MADKKVDATTGEVQEEKKLQYFERPKLDLDETMPDPDAQEDECLVGIKVHCKPVFNYQSVEFDWIIHLDANDIEEEICNMEVIYARMLRMLVKVSENAPQKDFKPVQQVEEPATEKQIEVMNTFHIKYPKDVTRKQAQELIKANISAVK